MMIDLQEIRLARELGTVIEAELMKGTKLPEEVLVAYMKLYRFWQEQMSRELS